MKRLWAEITFERCCRVAWLLVAAAFVHALFEFPTAFTVRVQGGGGSYALPEPVHIEIEK